MRITAGTFKGRILSSPEGLATRPTSDRARQAIFNIINHAGWRTRDLLDEASVLDVFSGTGALGLEALSQGAAHAAFMDNAVAAVNCCRDNIGAMKLQDRTNLFKCDATHPVPKPDSLRPRDLVFLDPPYGQGLGERAIAALIAKKWIADDCVFVWEMAKKEPEALPDMLALQDERSYGVALVRFLTLKA